MIIETVKQYNQRQFKKLQKALQDWRDGKRKVYPVLGQFCFTKKDGNLKQYGYVASENRPSFSSAVWAKTKKEAIEKMKKQKGYK